MRETLLKILEEIAPDIDFEVETELIENGLLESFDIVQLVSEISDEFHVNIAPRDLTPENFNSVGGMMAMIKRLQEA